MNNNQPTILLSLRSNGTDVVDAIKENKWANDLGAKTKINKNENPFGNPNGCIEFAGGKDRLVLQKYNSNFDMSNTDWTVSLWAKYSNLPPYTNSRGFGIILSHANIYANNNNSIWYELYLGRDRCSPGMMPGVTVDILSPSGGYNVLAAPNCNNFMQWTHVAWCYVHATKQLFTFINGKKY